MRRHRPLCGEAAKDAHRIDVVADERHGHDLVDGLVQRVEGERQVKEDLPSADPREEAPSSCRDSERRRRKRTSGCESTYGVAPAVVASMPASCLKLTYSQPPRRGETLSTASAGPGVASASETAVVEPPRVLSRLREAGRGPSRVCAGTEQLVHSAERLEALAQRVPLVHRLWNGSRKSRGRVMDVDL